MKVNDKEITPRELAVWTCIALGLTRKETTAKLGAGEHAAANAARPLYRKIGAKCKADATRLAVKHGVIVVEVER
jgi:DNA-binding CsgD family transcriptional regulator